MSAAPPASYVCPITGRLMDDPVMDPDGNTYERAAITEWLRQHPTSPITRAPLDAAVLVPNRALRDAIDDYRRSLSTGSAEEPSALSTTPTLVPAGPIVLSTATFPASGTESVVVATLTPPPGTQRTPTDICCVIDISGSMGSSATIGGSDEVESTGLTILDIVKHAVRTIISTLSGDDRLALVAYSDRARPVFNLVPMTDEGKRTAQAAVELLDTEGSTNLWDGLYTGLEILRRDRSPARLAALMILTDGQPNIDPPRGTIPTLKRYQDEHGGLPCVIHSFGFGYGLDSVLMREIANLGSGTYNFIPDAGFVGTVFVNVTANVLSTMARDTIVNVEPQPGTTVLPVPGRHRYTECGAGAVVIHLGPVQYGQTKDIVIRLQSAAPAAAPAASLSARYTVVGDLTVTIASSRDTVVDNADADVLRLGAVDAILDGMALVEGNDSNAARSRIADHIVSVKRSASAAALADLLFDLEGQVTEAFSRDDWYQRWGRHYLPSLAQAHQMQMCNNFKDKGVQRYGGRLFQTIRDAADLAFCRLPPPRPSGHRVAVSSLGAAAAAPAPAPVSMAAFNNASNPCIDGECYVTYVPSGNLVRVRDVRAGDRVATSPTSSSIVLCVVETLTGGRAGLVEVADGVRVTPWHPVLMGGRWRFPAETLAASTCECHAVYGFVMDDDASGILVNGHVVCAPLGHNMAGDVIGHAFFGNRKRVLASLQGMKGWQRGKISFAGPCMVRDPGTGHVVGFSTDAEVL